jgi:hypothetical protein
MSEPTTGNSADSTTEDPVLSDSASHSLPLSELSHANPTAVAEFLVEAREGRVAQGVQAIESVSHHPDEGTETAAIEQPEAPNPAAPLQTDPSKLSLVHRKTSLYLDPK